MLQALFPSFAEIYDIPGVLLQQEFNCDRHSRVLNTQDGARWEDYLDIWGVGPLHSFSDFTLSCPRVPTFPSPQSLTSQPPLHEGVITISLLCPPAPKLPGCAALPTAGLLPAVSTLKQINYSLEWKERKNPKESM